MKLCGSDKVHTVVLKDMALYMMSCSIIPDQIATFGIVSIKHMINLTLSQRIEEQTQTGESTVLAI